MYDFAYNYPYFGMSLIICIFLFVCLFLLSAHRKIIFFSGLLSIPFCLYEFFFIPSYWKPAQMFGLIISPSDILFSFATGGMAWATTSLFIKKRIQWNFNVLIFMRRFLICSLLGFCIFVTLWIYDLKIMTSVLLCILIGIIGISLRCRELGIELILGASVFVLYYMCILKLCYIIWPHFYGHWNIINLWGLSFAGLPLEEIVWAFAFGIIWPKFSIYALNGTLIHNATYSTKSV